MAKATYKDAGVDLEAYREAMGRLPRLLRRTYSPRVLSAGGGFAGLFSLDFDGSLFARNYQDPVLVSATDGVGTKIKVAQRARRHDTIGIDLVAMCANDAICTGAELLFFLDYVAMPSDDPPLLEQIVAGISDGCIQCDLALVAGETAIMPELYQPGDYDLAGFCIGVVERRRVIDGSQITPGDVALGVAASGLHSNGFSLVRHIVFEMAGLDMSDHVAECGATVGELLLEPTRLYARPLRSILNHYRVKSIVHGVAHITGGGLAENLKRILPPGVALELDRGAWPIPPVFSWLAKLGDVAEEEMFRVFNMGIGLVLVASRYFTESIQAQLAECGLESWQVGNVRPGEKSVRWV